MMVRTIAISGGTACIAAADRNRWSVASRTIPARTMHEQANRTIAVPGGLGTGRDEHQAGDDAQAEEQVVEALVQCHRPNDVGMLLRGDLEPCPDRRAREDDALEVEEADVQQRGDDGGDPGDEWHARHRTPAEALGRNG